jgi:hypothetical protein
MPQNMSLRPIGWIGCVRCEKCRRDFVARTNALIAPVRPVFHRSWCSNETVRNATKLEFEVQWGRLGAFDAKNSESTLLHELVKSKTPQNMSLSPIGWIGCVHCEKFRRDFVGRTNAVFAPVWCNLHRSWCSNGMVRNAPKHKFESNRVDRVHSLGKNSDATSLHKHVR